MAKSKTTARLKNVATAQWDFAQLRENDDYVYVDKTDVLAQLAAKEKDALYFISRARLCRCLRIEGRESRSRSTAEGLVIFKSKNRKIDESKNYLGRHQV